MLAPARTLALAVASSLVLAASALAQQAAPKIDCEQATTTPELAYCAAVALKEADDNLNRTYRAALASIGEANHLQPAQRRDWRRALQEAQRHWIAFRDADCGPLIGWEWFQGTGMGTASLVCKSSKTEARTEELAVRYLGADGRSADPAKAKR